MNRNLKLAPVNITAWLGRRSRRFHTVVTVLMFAVVVGLRYATPYPIHVSVMFLLPISYATWFLAPVFGWSLAVLAVGVELLFDARHQGKIDHSVLYLNAFMNLTMFAILVFVFSEVRSLYRRAQELSLHDSLTGLLNRRALMNAITLESRRMQRRHYPFTLAYIDLDDFKEVNDRLGHSGGDVFLQELAAVMKKTVRATDFVARLGGDEFVLLLPETGPTAAHRAMSKVHNLLLQCTCQNDARVTLSVGVVTFETGARSSAEALQIADEAMYQVKRNGKNGIQFLVFRAGELANNKLKVS